MYLPTITLRDHLAAAELIGEAFAAEQRRLARIRALRRAVAHKLQTKEESDAPPV